MEQWTPEQLRDCIVEHYDSAAHLFELVNRWLARGDQVCVYQNADLSHPGRGNITLTSYGSAQAQLERTQFPEGPPQTMPDIGKDINWRYQLLAVCQSGPVPLPA